MTHLEWHDAITSTADVLIAHAKSQHVPHGTLLAAGMQTAGHGRGGAEKPFFSPPGGLYMSLLLRDENCIPPEDELPITPRAALAARRVLARHGCAVSVKWVNDLYIGAKKTGGILTQAANGAIVVSYGINLYPAVPPPDELQDMITYCFPNAAASPALQDFAQELAEELIAICALRGQNELLLTEYRAASAVLGKDVTYEENGRLLCAAALDITPTGGLVVRNSTGDIKTLTSGEIRLRLAKK